MRRGTLSELKITVEKSKNPETIRTPEEKGSEKGWENTKKGGL